jgi:hypothetical protein
MAPTGRTLPLRLLERLGVALLLLAACVPRVRGLSGPFDREFDGFQGAFFSIACVNYERLGVWRFGGYPCLDIDLSEEPGAQRTIYTNHPPAMPLLAYASVKLLGPAGWGDAWRSGRAPEGIEFALRLPFLACHLLGLLAFWWALRQAGGPRVALLGLALLAALPISIAYAQLVNYENPSLPWVLLGCGFHARWLRGRPGRNLLWAALSFAAGTSVTFAPLFFLPPLLLQALVRRGARDALRAALALGGAACVPLALHAAWVRAGAPEAVSEGLLARAEVLLSPLFTGEAPLHEWARRQGVRLLYYGTWPLVLAALGGLCVALIRARGRRERGAPVELGPPLLAGGLFYLLAFYHHTFDGAGVFDGQTIFLINLAPGLAALAAALLDSLTAPLARLRGGIAPLVVAASLLALPGLQRANELFRLWREPGPADGVPGGRGPATPLPPTTGAEVARLLPPGALGFYPASVSVNLAPCYYAWRTLLPVTQASFGERLGQARVRGLAGRERYLLLPKDPPPAVLADVGGVRAELATAGAPAAEDERWELWRLAND